MKIISLTAALLMAGFAIGCKDQTKTGGTTHAAQEDGPSCTTGAGAARNRMLTGEEEKAAPDAAAPGRDGSRLKGGAEVPAKVTNTGTEADAGTIPGASKEVEFEANTKAGDQATRDALDKILDKTPTVKP